MSVAFIVSYLGAAIWPNAATALGGGVALMFYAGVIMSGLRWLWLKAYPRRAPMQRRR